MAEDKTKLIISVDWQGGSAISAAIGDLNAFEKKTESIGKTTDQLQAGLKAFSWTTFTQGALNASTAIAQLYTSVSNLNRVQYLVKQATVSVERAEDQLARKTMQLTKEIEKNGSATDKAKQLRNEITTATEQLANKQERLALSMDQVNDTYILFGSNIANTVFGVIQTLIGLKTMAAQRVIANKVALDQETISLGANAAAARLNAAAHNSMISSRAGLIAGVSPLKNVLDEASSGMGVATKATGLLSSTLGKAGLIGSIAAVGISLGALAYDQFQTANKTQKTVDSVKDLTKSMDELGKTVSASIPLMEMNFSKIGDFSSVLDSYQENIDMIMQKRQKLLEEKAKLEKDFFKPTWFGPSQAELAKSAYEADKAKAQADVLGLMEKEKKFVAEQHIKNILGSFLEKGVGTTFKELTGTDILLGESITSKVKSDLNKIEEIVKTTNKSFDEVAAAWGKQNGYMVAGIQVTEAEYINLMGVTNSYIKTLSNSTDEMDQNNKAFKEHIKLLKEIGELKKKTSLSYQKGLQRTLFESLVSGDLSLNDDTLEKIVGADRVKAVGYQAFSGYMNKKTREIRMNLELVQAADWLYTQTEVLGSLVEALRGTAPDDPMRGQLLSMIDLTRKGIETSKFGRNIASSYDLSTNLGKAATSILSNYKELGQVRAMSLAQFLQSPSATSKSVTLGGQWSEGTALFNAWQKYGGENLTGQQAKDFWEKWMPKTSIPTNVGGISKALSRSSLSGSMYSTVSKYSGSLTASRGTSGRRRGGGGFHGRGGYTQDQINAVVAAYTGGLVSRRQSLLDSISNVVNLLAPLQQFGVFIDSSELQDIPQVPGFTWKWEGIRTMDLMEYAKNVYQPMAQQFYSALSNKESIFSSEFTRVFSSVGVTSYNDLMTQLANPLTSDDVENTLRFNARLEQISTGATVL